jgi:UPF0716 protein FxsA
MIVLLVFVLWAALELFVVIKVADAIGVLATVVLLLLTWPLGSWALRSQGRAAWRRLVAAVSAGRSPGREVLDGALVLVGGVLGVLALLPPTRALMRRGLTRNLQRRLVVTATRFTGASRPYDVDSTASDVDQPQLHP